MNSGDTGSPGSNHVHIELWLDGIAVDPIDAGNLGDYEVLENSPGYINQNMLQGNN